MKIESKDVVDIINSSKGKFFSAVFIKKDGTLRTMNCRLGVKKYLKGGELRFSPSKKGLVVVFDRDKKEYRMININTTQSLKVNGKEYHVNTNR